MTNEADMTILLQELSDSLNTLFHHWRQEFRGLGERSPTEYDEELSYSVERLLAKADKSGFGRPPSDREPEGPNGS